MIKRGVLGKLNLSIITSIIVEEYYTDVLLQKKQLIKTSFFYSKLLNPIFLCYN